MEAPTIVPQSEIVRVISECRLVDSQSEEQVYWRRDGCGLAPGYYVVRHDGATPHGAFNEDVEFRGPYSSRKDALKAMAQ
jgi:hypothetical protein